MDKKPTPEEFMHMDFSKTELRMLALIKQNQTAIGKCLGVPEHIQGRMPPGLYKVNYMVIPSEAFTQLAQAFSSFKPDLIVFDGLSKLFHPKPCVKLIEKRQLNKQHGWYRQFEKPSKKRNKKL